MRFTCCLNTAFNLTKPLWALIFLHEVTRKSIAAVTDHFVELLFSKTLYASMKLWRHYDVRKFDADAILFRKNSVRNGIFYCLRDVFSAV